MEVLAVIIQACTLLTTVMGVVYAVYNFDSWRREHRGKRQAELAEDVLALFYEAVEIIGIVRNPGGWPDEVTTLTQRDRETAVQFDARKRAYVVFKRFAEHKDVLSKLYAMRFRFMATFGKEASKPFDNFRSVQHQISVAGGMLSVLWARRANEEHRTEAQRIERDALIEKHENVFWEMLPEDDRIKPQLEAIIGEIEATCRGIIEAKDTLFGFINKRVL